MKMPIINSIPKRYEKGFHYIASLASSAFEAFYDGISLTSLSKSIDSLSEKIKELIGFEVEISKEILLSVGSLIPLLTEDNRNEVVEDIVKLYKNKNPETDTAVLAERLHKLFVNTQIYHAAKATELIGEYQSVFLSARLLTDIRPIFGDKINADPKAALVIHNLHIHYQAHREGDHKDIYLALDAKDIKILKGILDRAEEKEKILDEILTRTGINNLHE